MLGAYKSSHISDERIAAHRHSEAYAALVLDGEYDELSADGRYPCSRGILTIHPAWHQHSDEIGKSGATILNWPMNYSDGLCSVKIVDVEAITRLARRCPIEATNAALEEAELINPISPAPWLVSLTALLASESSAEITDLAAACGVSNEHAIRACKKWFGTSPGALRRELRLQRAIKKLQSGAKPAQVAADMGFSDQPHLTRLLKRATGLTPTVISAI
jgi:AraC-like DNA-binding protein